MQFFKGVTPEDAMRTQEAAQFIFDMLWSICPNCRPFNQVSTKENNFTVYPILDCCIVSYTSEDGIKYQMFDTKLK